MNPFDNAIAYLKKYGWTRGRMREIDGRACCLGALLYGNITVDSTVQSHAELTRAERWLSHFVALRVGAPNWGRNTVPMWNDHVVRSVEEVIEMLEAASEAWELEQQLGATEPAESRPSPFSMFNGWIPPVQVELEFNFAPSTYLKAKDLVLSSA